MHKCLTILVVVSIVRWASSLYRGTSWSATGGPRGWRVSDCFYESWDDVHLLVLCRGEDILRSQVDLILLLTFSCNIDFDHVHTCYLSLLFLHLLVGCGLIDDCILLHVLVADVYQILVQYSFLNWIVELVGRFLDSSHFNLIDGHLQARQGFPRILGAWHGPYYGLWLLNLSNCLLLCVVLRLILFLNLRTNCVVNLQNRISGVVGLTLHDRDSILLIILWYLCHIMIKLIFHRRYSLLIVAMNRDNRVEVSNSAATRLVLISSELLLRALAPRLTARTCSHTVWPPSRMVVSWCSIDIVQLRVGRQLLQRAARVTGNGIAILIL